MFSNEKFQFLKKINITRSSTFSSSIILGFIFSICNLTLSSAEKWSDPSPRILILRYLSSKFSDQLFLNLHSIFITLSFKRYTTKNTMGPSGLGSICKKKVLYIKSWKFLKKDLGFTPILSWRFVDFEERVFYLC